MGEAPATYELAYDEHCGGAAEDTYRRNMAAYRENMEDFAEMQRQAKARHNEKVQRRFAEMSSGALPVQCSPNEGQLLPLSHTDYRPKSKGFLS